MNLHDVQALRDARPERLRAPNTYNHIILSSLQTHPQTCRAGKLTARGNVVCNSKFCQAVRTTCTHAKLQVQILRRKEERGIT